MQVKARQFQPGDTLGDGAVVVGVVGIVRGGVRVAVLDTDGSRHQVVVSGRYRFTVSR